MYHIYYCVHQSHTRKWLQFSDALRVHWRLYFMRQTAYIGDYKWKTAIWAVSVSERTTLPVWEVNIVWWQFCNWSNTMENVSNLQLCHQWHTQCKFKKGSGVLLKYIILFLPLPCAFQHDWILFLWFFWLECNYNSVTNLWPPSNFKLIRPKARWASFCHGALSVVRLSSSVCAQFAKIAIIYFLVVYRCYTLM